MASYPTPFMANILLYYYESKWVKGLKKNYLHKARKFGNTFRFIDNLLLTFDDDKKETYPGELQLNLEGSGNRLSFLDVDLKTNKRS